MSETMLAINSALYKQAKQHAEELGITLHQLVERHLRELLTQRSDIKHKITDIRKEGIIITFNQYAQRLIKKHASTF